MQNSEINKRDEDFLEQYEEYLKDFLEGDESVIDLDPMNSYYRRLIHNLSVEFNLKTESKGEGKERYIILTKTKDSKLPEGIRKKRKIVWNFGDREYLVNPLKLYTEVFLAKDGSVGLCGENNKNDYLARKKVVSGSFKIKMNKIVELHDEEW